MFDDVDVLVSQLAASLSAPRRTAFLAAAETALAAIRAQLAQPIPAAAQLFCHDALPRRQRISDANGHGVLRSILKAAVHHAARRRGGGAH